MNLTQAVKELREQTGDLSHKLETLRLTVRTLDPAAAEVAYDRIQQSLAETRTAISELYAKAAEGVLTPEGHAQQVKDVLAVERGRQQQLVQHINGLRKRLLRVALRQDRLLKSILPASEAAVLLKKHGWTTQSAAKAMVDLEGRIAVLEKKGLWNRVKRLWARSSTQK